MQNFRFYTQDQRDEEFYYRSNPVTGATEYRQNYVLGDSNRNGGLTKTEARSNFNRIQRNSRGTTPETRDAARDLANNFDQYDTNKDGKITFTELRPFQATQTELLARYINQVGQVRRANQEEQ